MAQLDRFFKESDRRAYIVELFVGKAQIIQGFCKGFVGICRQSKRSSRQFKFFLFVSDQVEVEDGLGIFFILLAEGVCHLFCAAELVLLDVEID